MTDLENMLAENKAPTPRGSLSDSILSAAQTITPANDTPSRRPWWAVGSIAAVAIAAFLVIQPFNQAPVETDAELVAAAEWEDLAQTVGFSDLYAWVEETPTEEDS